MYTAIPVTAAIVVRNQPAMAKIADSRLTRLLDAEAIPVRHAPGPEETGSDLRVVHTVDQGLRVGEGKSGSDVHPSSVVHGFKPQWRGQARSASKFFFNASFLSRIICEIDVDGLRL